MASIGISELAFSDLDELSGGQRQFVSIAQTLSRDPEIMLLDEPTSALDMGRQTQVLDLMRRLAQDRGMIVFIALHDLNQVLRFADQVLVIADGRARSSGPCEDVVTVAMLREVYRINARIERCA
jgi:iron complex transport system ATP-binding protein